MNTNMSMVAVEKLNVTYCYFIDGLSVFFNVLIGLFDLLKH